MKTVVKRSYPRWFSQGKAYPLHSGYADPCYFPKCDCVHALPWGKKKREKVSLTSVSFAALFE
jgi:hypothetical protein